MKRNERKKRLRRLACVLWGILLLFGLKLAVNERRAYTPPAAEREDIRGLLSQESFSDGDYQTLLLQTGLGRAAIDALKERDGFADMVLRFQEQFFAPIEYRCGFVFPTTKEERLTDASGVDRELLLAPVEDGDVVITRATHTLGWRHGHAAIVVDAERGITVESVMLGQKSSRQTLEKWSGYPSVLILRPKQRDAAGRAAAFADEKLVDVDYSLLVGMLRKDKRQMQTVDSTQCAHLVWQAYRAVGVDLDADGWLVTPKELANSPELELVQAFGFDPVRRWE